MKFTIKQARLITGMTQVEMAITLGMSEKTYIQYEKYRKIFRMDIAARFVRTVKLSIDEIIFFEIEVQ